MKMKDLERGIEIKNQIKSISEVISRLNSDLTIKISERCYYRSLKRSRMTQKVLDTLLDERAKLYREIEAIWKEVFRRLSSCN